MAVDCSSMLRFVNYCLMRRETVEGKRKLFLLVQMPQPSAMPFGWDTGICVACSCLFTLHISEEYKSYRKHWSDRLSNGRSWVNKLIVFRGFQKVGHTIESTIITICIPALHLLLCIINSTRPTASKSHQVTTGSWLAGNFQSTCDVNRHFVRDTETWDYSDLRLCLQAWISEPLCLSHDYMLHSDWLGWPMW